jgi:D-glycero-D-manno-heptose 1,7-bisphosphate phosphatase
MKPAVFLDRDGVLIEDVNLVTRAEQMRLLPGVPEAMRALRSAGFLLVVVTNQPVVARGLATESEVRALHLVLEEQLAKAGGPRPDAVYFCPHHPRAERVEYRLLCECRKPRPGMLLEAARHHRIDLRASFIVGDRITDIAAGFRAGCRTVLVETGKHLEQPITLAEPLEPGLKPDATLADLAAAARWILEQAA